MSEIPLDTLIAHLKKKLEANPIYQEIRSHEVEAARLRTQLEADAIFQELKLWEETRARLLAIRGSNSPKEESAGTIPERRGGPRGRISIMAAVHEALKAANHPLTTNQLLERVPIFGAEMSGTDKKANLVSQLSGMKTTLAKQLISVKWNGNSTWWFRDRPLPFAPHIPPNASNQGG
ncbi:MULTISPECIES: hypothetical protein [Rhodomicrobium]|uniref:hypothetical protein n=1 Tax=Rhodomicrobium TaxID=1068 RepID=UPI000F74BA72|nr:MULTISPECIES: hypothetical protein [Rhodomicrobium]